MELKSIIIITIDILEGCRWRGPGRFFKAVSLSRLDILHDDFLRWWMLVSFSAPTIGQLILPSVHFSWLIASVLFQGCLPACTNGHGTDSFLPYPPINKTRNESMSREESVLSEVWVEAFILTEELTGPGFDLSWSTGPDIRLKHVDCAPYIYSWKWRESNLYLMNMDYGIWNMETK